MGKPEQATTEAMRRASRQLCSDISHLRFPAPITHVYNPLEYASAMVDAYLELAAATHKRVIFLGMNPGPWGMAQNGVPFGEISAVRDWMHLKGRIDSPPHPHPKRPILGLNCPNSEVSGRRLWGLFAQRFGSATTFFQDHFVANYCPLVFMEESGRNHTPDKLPAACALPLFEACDKHLRRITEILQPEWVVGVGAFAETRAREALQDFDVRICRVLHPSPASPAANRDWAGAATRTLCAAGIWPA